MSPAMLAGYGHLLTAARRLQWDETAIALGADAARTAELGAVELATLTTLVAGFCLAERAVAAELDPYVVAARETGGDPVAAECFAVQAADEDRHARFFERVAREVLGVDDADAAARQAPPAIAQLFAGELPATARALAADAATLPAAVGLYHLVLEGIVFAVGQEALRALADTHGLTGIAEGTARVQGDERWHIGLGVLCLQRLRAPVALDVVARRAIGAWGPQIATAQRTERVLAVHARRVRIATA